MFCRFRLGKTTLIRMLAGNLEPDQGGLLINDEVKKFIWILFSRSSLIKYLV